MQSNERESSFQRKSKVSPLPPFSVAIERFWRSANSLAISRSRACTNQITEYCRRDGRRSKLVQEVAIAHGRKRN